MSIKKRIVWLLISCLMVLSLVIASCGQKEAEEAKVTEEEGQVVITKQETEEQVKEEKEVVALVPEMVEVTLTKVDGTTMKKTVEKPKYGGTLNLLSWGGTAKFDPFMYFICNITYMTTEPLISGDWYRSPVGTGENDMLYGFAGRFEMMKGWLCESWDLPDAETIVFYIRPGIHWWNKPPVNGRELTAEDVAWTMNKFFTSYGTYYYPYTQAGQAPTSIKALDKYTVELKVIPEMRGMLLLEIGCFMMQFPPEPWETYGSITDWKNTMGTGAWMVEDLVPSVSITFERNPDYWQRDPIFPENQLPYPDRLRWLEIPDKSTQLAAFRTGSVDNQIMMTSDDAELLLQQNPELEYVQGLADGYNLCGRVDKQELPFKDLRVRQALNLAINREEIIEGYFGGHADLLGYPIKNAPVFEPYWTPLEEMPSEPIVEGSQCSVQELFTYNPEKAKQLLAEAGYPNGFKTQVVINGGSSDMGGADFTSLIKQYLLNIGVDMEIKPLEMGAYMGVWNGRTQEEMIWSISKSSHPYMFYEERESQIRWDSSFWEDEHTLAAYDAVGRNLGESDAEVIRIVKGVAPDILENAWGIWMPVPYVYHLWWPWFKNYYGASDIGYNQQLKQYIFCWVDEALKESMGY